MYIRRFLRVACLGRRYLYETTYLEFGDFVGIASSMVIQVLEVRERYVRKSPGFSSELKLLDFFPSGNRMR